MVSCVSQDRTYFHENLFNCFGKEGMRYIYMYVHGTSRYGDSQRVEFCGDQIQVEARFFFPVRTGTDVHTASYERGTIYVLLGEAACKGR